MNVETTLIWLNAVVMAGALSYAPLISRTRNHFYEPENETDQTWAYLQDAFFARALLTGILSTIVLFLGLTIAKGLLMKGVSEPVRAGFEHGTHLMTIVVLIVGGYGALRQRVRATRVLKAQSLPPPERQNMVLKIVLFVAVVALYVPALQRAISWLHGEG